MKHTLFLLALAWAACVHAAPKISGGTSYKFGADNASVTMSCDAITNSSAENATGTIQVQLWALVSPFEGGTISGTVLGAYKLEGLEGGRQYKGFSKSVKTTLPKSRGSYSICMTVSEYRSQGYVITDWRNYPNPVTLAPARLFTMEGPWSWQANYEAGTVSMKVKKISHTRSTNTGSLRLELWACPKPYTGGQISGVRMGSVQKQALKAGFVFNDVENIAKLARPAAGTYHIVLVLLEYNNDKYGIVAHLNSTKPSVFN